MALYGLNVAAVVVNVGVAKVENTNRASYLYANRYEFGGFFVIPLMGKLPLTVGNQILYRDVILGERGKCEFRRLGVKAFFCRFAGMVGAFRDS